jgi:hypothetical protein
VNRYSGPIPRKKINAKNTYQRHLETIGNKLGEAKIGVILKDHCDIPAIFHMEGIPKGRAKICWGSIGVNPIRLPNLDRYVNK